MKLSFPVKLISRRGSATKPVHIPEPAGRLSNGLFLAVPIVFAALAAASYFGGLSLSPLAWHLVRATGLVLYLLFWGMTVLGLLLTTGVFDRIASRGSVLSLHTYLTHLAYSFLAAHLLSLVIDPNEPYVLAQLVTPFASPSPEPWTGFGVLAMYLFIVIVASASLRRYIPYSVWRFLHILSFPMYAISLLHGIGSGSDTGSPVVNGFYLVTAFSVLVLCLVRIEIGHRGGSPVTSGVTPPPIDRLGGQTRRPPATREQVQ